MDPFFQCREDDLDEVLSPRRGIKQGFASRIHFGVFLVQDHVSYLFGDFAAAGFPGQKEGDALFLEQDADAIEDGRLSATVAAFESQKKVL